MLCAVLLALLQTPTDEFQKRVRIDGNSVLVDDQVLYEGPWKKADVKIADVGGKKARAFFEEFTPWKQVVVLIDGEERARLPVKSLARPVAWPPTRLEDVKPAVKKLTETVGGRKSFVVLVSTDTEDIEIYRGPEYETKVDRTISSFTVTLGGEPLYRLSRPDRPPPRV